MKGLLKKQDHTILSRRFESYCSPEEESSSLETCDYIMWRVF